MTTTTMDARAQEMYEAAHGAGSWAEVSNHLRALYLRIAYLEAVSAACRRPPTVDRLTDRLQRRADAQGWRLIIDRRSNEWTVVMERLSKPKRPVYSRMNVHTMLDMIGWNNVASSGPDLLAVLVEVEAGCRPSLPGYSTLEDIVYAAHSIYRDVFAWMATAVATPPLPPITALEFARAVQHLARCAREQGLWVPGFGSTPHQENAVEVIGDYKVSLRSRMNPRKAYACMVSGLLVINDRRIDPDGPPTPKRLPDSVIHALQDSTPEWIQ